MSFIEQQLLAVSRQAKSFSTEHFNILLESSTFAVQVNAFFLKYVLWIPPLNPLNTYRLLLLALLALPATKEYYTFIDSEETDIFNKLGPFAWLATAVAVGETLVCVKFGRGMFPKPWPSTVLLIWGAAALTFASFMAIWATRYYKVPAGEIKHKRT